MELSRPLNMSQIEEIAATVIDTPQLISDLASLARQASARASVVENLLHQMLQEFARDEALRPQLHAALLNTRRHVAQALVGARTEPEAMAMASELMADFLKAGGAAT